MVLGLGLLVIDFSLLGNWYVGSGSTLVSGICKALSNLILHSLSKMQPTQAAFPTNLSDLLIRARNLLEALAVEFVVAF